MLLRILVFAVLFAACAGEPDPRQARPSGAAEGTQPVADLPWTQEFMESAVLVAGDVSIEGPAGLLDHFVQLQDPEVHTYRVRTVPEGLMQETTVKELGSVFPIRCNLDNLSIVAERSLTVLERPGDVAVRVVARGDAYWKRTNSGNERRGELLELIGHRPR